MRRAKSVRFSEAVSQHGETAFGIRNLLNVVPRVKAIYTGESRKVSAAKRQHLNMLVTSFNVDQQVINQYDTEIRFLEGSDEHWLPVQKKLIPFFEKEVKKGEEVTLYAEWVGAKKISGKWEWVFMVHEFQKH